MGFEGQVSEANLGRGGDEKVRERDLEERRGHAFLSEVWV